MNLSAAVVLTRSPIQAALTDTLVFDSKKKMRHHIRAAARTISSHFQDIDAAISRGAKVRDAVAPDKVRQAVNNLYSSAMLSGYEDGAYFSNKRMPKDLGKKISAAASQRADDVDYMMRRVTKKGIKAGSAYALSPDRALRAARYEAGQAYYKGLKLSLAGSGMKKKWMTSSADPCQDCLDAEDEGKIDFDDQFQSGLFLPLAHIACQCYIVGSI
jgi:hypothetical protein